MSKPLKKLPRSIIKLNKALKKAASDNARDAAIEIVAKLAQATPVDTSKALSNWRATVGFPATRAIAAHNVGSRGSTKEASVNDTIEAARKSVRNKKVGQNVFITNNVDYMDELANGTGSPQQPSAGWIEAVSGITLRNWKFKYPVFK